MDSVSPSELPERQVISASVESHLTSLGTFWEHAARALSSYYGAKIDEELMGIRLAFYEAMANVIKHAHQEDGRPIDFRLSLSGRQVELSIFDTGPGYTPDPSQNLVDEESESGRGVFLLQSLATEFKYIEKDEHNITYLRKELELRNSNPPKRSAAPPKRSTEASETDKRVVLIAEDDEVMRHLVARLVTQMGHQALLARNGHEALDFFSSSTHIDAALIDVIMPELDGLEVTRTVREKEKESYYTPILLLTSKDKAEDIAAGLDAGADEYVIKPPRKTELFARLRAAFRLHDMTAKLRAQAEQIEGQLREAQTTQCAMLPPASFHTGPYSCASVFRPSHYVGGDMFNGFRIDEEVCGFYLADVSGHGVPAALLSMWLNRTLQPLRGPGTVISDVCDEPPGYRIFSPAEICKALDKILGTEECEKYLTMAFVQAYKSTGTLSYCNAGHPPPLIKRLDGSWELLEVGGPPVGMDLGLPFENGTTHFESGERLFLYSDGVIECFSQDGTPFGEKRLLETLDQYADLNMGEQLQQTVAVLSAHANSSTFEDDVTLLGVELRR